MDAPEARRLLAIIDKVDPARVLAESVVTMMRRDGIDVTQIQTVMRAVGQYLASSASAVPSEPPPPPDYGDGSECCASGSCEVCSPWRFR